MTTPNIDLPTSPAGPSNLSVAYNTAMQILDMLVVLVIQDRTLSAPPSTLVGDLGKRWIVGPTATGVWAGHENDIAVCVGADLWTYFTPGSQWRGWVIADGAWYRYTGSAWIDDTAAGAISEAPVDGTSYSRKDGTWLATSIAWGSVNGALVDQLDLQAALDAKLSTATRGLLANINEQTGTTYTVATADVGLAVRIVNTGAITVTIPTDTTDNIPLFCMIPIYQGGTGLITVAPADGTVSIESPFGLDTAGQGDFRMAFKRAANTWVIS
jgi:hypothetical protein